MCFLYICFSNKSIKLHNPFSYFDKWLEIKKDYQSTIVLNGHNFNPEIILFLIPLTCLYLFYKWLFSICRWEHYNFINLRGCWKFLSLTKKPFEKLVWYLIWIGEVSQAKNFSAHFCIIYLRVFFFIVRIVIVSSLYSIYKLLIRIN